MSRAIASLQTAINSSSGCGVQASMEDVHPSRGAIGFGVFELDLRAGKLREDSVKIKLQK